MALEVIAEYMELRVKKYEDGKFEAYDAIGDCRKEADTWQEIKDWINDTLIPDIENECPDIVT